MKLHKNLFTSILFVFLYISLSSSTDKPESQANIVQAKLNALSSEISLVHNEHVQGYINLYTQRKRELSSKIIARSDYYFPIFDQVFETYDIPKELKYLAVIESALNPNAVSPKGATGIWQFMYSTAQLYKLNMNSDLDERKDPYLSTIAAASYLKKSYNIFGDWLLAIASYNCGPGNVSKAIKKAGGKKDFWKIYSYLPKETRGYVPAFIAAVYFMEYSNDFELFADESFRISSTTSYKVVGDLYLKELISKLDIEEENFRWLNPALKGDVIPANYQLNIPQTKSQVFLSQLDSLYAVSEIKIEELAASKKSQFVNLIKNTTKAKVSKLIAAKPKERKIDPNKEVVIYMVKEGDNIGTISSWFDVKLDDLKYWNNLKSNKIVTGSELMVYVDKEEVPHYKRFDYFSNRIKNVLSTDRQKRLLYTPEREANSLFHKVEKGETLSVIANIYEVSVNMIKENNFLDKQYIMPGMYLKISAKQL